MFDFESFLSSSDWQGGNFLLEDDPIEFAGAASNLLGDTALESGIRINGQQTLEDKIMVSSMATKYWSLLI